MDMKMNMPMMNMPKMWMWFHTEINDTVLFKFWTVNTVGMMLVSCLIVFVFGIGFELLKWLRWRLEVIGRQQASHATRTKYAVAVIPPRNYRQKLFSLGHLAQTVLFGVQVVLSYLLMLVFMTFSVWLGLAVTAGAAAGYYLFGSRELPRAQRVEPQQRAHPQPSEAPMSIREPVLFHQWLPETITAYVFSCIAIAALAILYEFIRLIRWYNYQVHAQKEPCCAADVYGRGETGTAQLPLDDPPPCDCSAPSISSSQPLNNSGFHPKPFMSLRSPLHISQSVLYFVQMFGSYSLMMISMTYNVPMFASIIAGHIIAYFLFGPLMSVEEEERIGDCCS